MTGAVTRVLLHPIGLDAGCWQFLPSDVTEGALPYVAPWHGGRPRPAGGLDLPSMADDLAERIDGPLDLIGLSMGGVLAQCVALQHPSRVNSLLLACCGAGGGDPAPLLRRADDVAREGMAGIVDPTLRRWFSATALESPGHPAVGYARRRLLTDDAESFATGWRALAGCRTLGRLHRITVPTTVMHAVDDEASGLQDKWEMVHELPRGRLVMISGPHMVQMERPHLFAGAVRDHLDWVGQVP